MAHTVNPLTFQGQTDLLEEDPFHVLKEFIQFRYEDGSVTSAKLLPYVLHNPYHAWVLVYLFYNVYHPRKEFLKIVKSCILEFAVKETFKDGAPHEVRTALPFNHDAILGDLMSETGIYDFKKFILDGAALRSNEALKVDHNTILGDLMCETGIRYIFSVMRKRLANSELEPDDSWYEEVYKALCAKFFKQREGFYDRNDARLARDYLWPVGDRTSYLLLRNNHRKFQAFNYNLPDAFFTKPLDVSAYVIHLQVFVDMPMILPMNPRLQALLDKTSMGVSMTSELKPALMRELAKILWECVSPADGAGNIYPKQDVIPIIVHILSYPARNLYRQVGYDYYLVSSQLIQLRGNPESSFWILALLIFFNILDKFVESDAQSWFDWVNPDDAEFCTQVVEALFFSYDSGLEETDNEPYNDTDVESLNNDAPFVESYDAAKQRNSQS